MLGHIRLADIEGVLEVAHAFDALGQLFKDLDADGMGDDLEEIDSLFYRNHIVVVSFGS